VLQHAWDRNLGRLTAQEEQEEKKKDAVYDVFEAISKAAETKVR
jgi:hypothetical protein